MRKLCSAFILCLLSVIGASLINVNAESEVDFLYTIENETVRIDDCLINNTEISIPSEIDGYPVTALGGYIFDDGIVTSVVIPDTVTFIDECTFHYSSIGNISVASGNRYFLSSDGILFD